MHILRFIALHGIYYVVNFILFSLENDDMESSKRCVKLPSKEVTYNPKLIACIKG